MHTLPQSPEEEPTRKVPHVPTSVLVKLERVVRLADESSALLIEPSGPRVALAVVNLASIAALAREVLS